MTQNRSNFADAYRQINEKLKASDGAGAYIDDFRKSDAPQFKGKSDKKIQKMAVAAYLDDKDKTKKEDVDIEAETKYDMEEAKDMNPADHVAKSKKNPDKFCVFDKDGNEVKLFDKEEDAIAYAKANHDKLMENIEETKVFVVRFLDPANKKRFAVPYKDKKSADDKMKQLKRDGVKEIEVTKDVLKRGVKFREDYESIDEGVELDEAKFAVKLSFLPKPIYVDSESSGKVKMQMRKALKKPEDIESVERVMPADYKSDLRNRIKGKKDDEDGEEKTEALDKKDAPTVKDVIGQLKGAVKAHGKQAKDLEKALKTEELEEKFKPEGGELFVVTAGQGDNAQKVIGMNKNLRKAQKMRDDYDRKNRPSKPSHKARVYAQSKQSQPRNKFKVGDDIKYSSFGNKQQFTKVKENFDEPEFSKKNFAFNRIGLVAKDLKKKELGKVTDEGRKSKYDMDQDDEEGANKNIIMQLRKSVDLKGRFDVEFEDGKKVKVKDTIARAAVLKHAGFRRPAEKLAFQTKIEKSYRDLLNALKGR